MPQTWQLNYTRAAPPPPWVRTLRMAGSQIGSRSRGGFGDAGHEAQEGGFAELGAGEFAGEAALAHDEDAAAQADEFGEFGGDDEEGFAFEGEFVEELVDFGLGADVDAAGGFVDDEDVAIAGEPFGEGDFLLVAAAEAWRWTVSSEGVLTRRRCA